MGQVLALAYEPHEIAVPPLVRALVQELERVARRTTPLVQPAFLGVQQATEYLWAETGRIPSYKLGALRRFRLSDLEDHLRARRQGHTVQPPTVSDRPRDWSAVDGMIRRSPKNDRGG
jgi:excisionase family DNA binding protein